MTYNVSRPGACHAIRHQPCYGLFVALLICATGTTSASGADADWYDRFYLGAGVVSVKGSANATGNFLESESKYSVVSRVDLGYEISLAPRFSLRGELYDLPQKTPLGLGDEAKNTWGFAVLPTLALRPDTKLFVGLGYERSHTDSPVFSWRSFSVDTPVLTAGASYSLEQTLNLPLSLSARYDYARYEKIDFQGQYDRIKQERLTFSADYRF